MKKNKIDYEAIALLTLAKQNYKKSEEFVKALMEHLEPKFNSDDAEGLIWERVIDQDSYSDLIKDLEENKKQVKKRKTTAPTQGGK